VNAPQTLDHDWFPRPLPEYVSLGERTWCYSSFAFAHCRSRRPLAVRVGHDTGIYVGTFFDLGPDGEVEIGDFCTLVGAIICTNAKVVISNYAFVAHEVTLADSFAATPGRPVARAATQNPVMISVGPNCWISARAVLLAGASIGEGAIVGAATVVDFEVPPYAIVAGSPARVVSWAKPPS
jgi:acetyltransferase-like isoleucine patch superfamily enzyme